jgi:hypothetical protein
MQKFSYVKTEATLSGKKRMEILDVINKGGKEVRKRLGKREIKITDITQVRRHCHNKVLNEDKSVQSYSEKFYITLKTGEKKIVNISKFF